MSPLGGMLRIVVVLLLSSGCFDAPIAHPADAAQPDSPVVYDAPAYCNRPDADTSACLQLAPEQLYGQTPFGDIDATLTSFSAGDCISHSGAGIEWATQSGDKLTIGFAYPTHSDECARRYIVGSFDETAVFTIAHPNNTFQQGQTTIHVDVTTWQEGNGVHSIDIVVTFTDAAYRLAPVHIVGTFCYWPYYVC